MCNLNLVTPQKKAEMVQAEVEGDKIPLFEDVESHDHRPRGNGCLSCCKHLWITIMLLVAGIITGVGTYPTVYGLVERAGPCPTEMMDEPCFAVFSTFFKVSLFLIQIFWELVILKFGDFKSDC